MTMPTANQIVVQINRLVGHLVETGLSDDQRYAFQRQVANGLVHVTFGNARIVASALRNVSYDEIYQNFVEERAYNVKMLDGALLQLMYIFANNELQRHRLAFFPAPHLEEFQNNPEIYLEDEVYADVVAKNIVPFPIRFDYDVRDDVHQDSAHPKSHLTLGQYQNCRIPVSSPLTPYWFVDFILRNFYHTAFNRYADNLSIGSTYFDESIAPSERNVIHITVPS